MAANGEHGVGKYGIGENGIGKYVIDKHGIGEYGIGEHGIGEYGIGEMLRHRYSKLGCLIVEQLVTGLHVSETGNDYIN